MTVWLQKQVCEIGRVQKSLLWALSGQWEKLKADYTITREAQGKRWEVTLVPKDKPNVRKPFQKLVARGEQYVEEAEVLLRGGITDHVAFSETTLAAP